MQIVSLVLIRNSSGISYVSFSNAWSLTGTWDKNPTGTWDKNPIGTWLENPTGTWDENPTGK